MAPFENPPELELVELGTRCEGAGRNEQKSGADGVAEGSGNESVRKKQAQLENLTSVPNLSLGYARTQSLSGDEMDNAAIIAHL